MTESLWSRTAKLPHFPALEGDKSVDCAVLGGGMAGVLTARLLAERGADVLLLEAETLGSGQTKNTTAKITAQHGVVYEKFRRELGEEKARQYARANQRSVEAYRGMVEAGGIDCGFETCPAYAYSAASAAPMEAEAEAAKALGLPAGFTTDTELPFPVKGAVRFDGQARFHPLRFLAAVAKGLEIREHTRVVKVEGGRVVTDRGTVEAKHIVFATHYPFVNAPGYYFLRMHQERSYVLALEGAPAMEGMYWGADPGGLSFRPAGDRLLLGGGNHRTGENSAGGRYRTLDLSAQKYYPQARAAERWSAQDCMTLDGVPYIGRFSAATPNWYVATGFGKWGMTSSMVSALLLSALICGEEDPDAPVFDPQRFRGAASYQNLLEEGKQAAKGLGRRLLEPGRAEVEALPRGHGGIVEVDGEKVGVYKNEKGETFTVSPKCPHLGCQVEWNPDEKSWDCPCHGSRFDFRGNLIDGPAQSDLATAGDGGEPPPP